MHTIPRYTRDKGVGKFSLFRFGAVPVSRFIIRFLAVPVSRNVACFGHLLFLKTTFLAVPVSRAGKRWE